MSETISSAAGTFWASLVRTVVPYAVGWLLALLTSWGIDADPELAGNLTTLLTLLGGSIYYLIVRLLETYVTPKFGWLLGLAKSPTTYTKGSAA